VYIHILVKTLILSDN